MTDECEYCQQADTRLLRQQIRYRAFLQAAETVEDEFPEAAEQLRVCAALIDAAIGLLETEHPDVVRS